MTAWQIVVTVILLAAFVPLLFWWTLWFILALLAWPASRADDSPAAPPPPGSILVDILIPAHNEELLLPRLLESLAKQAAQSTVGQVLVVADHCTDATAQIARSAGAQVLIRHSGPRGKPAALRDGLALLARRDNPASRAILILDADCTASANLLARTAAALAAGARVTQAAYLLDAGAARLHSAAAIAFGLKNVIRPRAMARLGIPTQLFGTGMCFRADLLAKINFENHLTEDLAISHDLLMAGIDPVFLPDAFVRSPLPEQRSAMSTQKMRWEAGQMRTWSKLPVMLLTLLVRGRLRAAIALADWSAPPVAMALLYVLGVAFADGVAVGLAWSPAWTLWIPLICIALLAGYVLIGGFQISGAAAVGRLFWALPRFLFWKCLLYGRMVLGHGPTAWERTPRGSEGEVPASRVSRVKGAL